MSPIVQAIDDSLLKLDPPATRMLHDPALTLAADTEPSLPRWQQIAQALRDDIVAGRFLPGERMPNELVLADSGFVRVLHGRGTFVRELVLDYALQRRTRLTQNLAESGERAQRELRHAEVVAAGTWAAPLRLQAREKVEVLHTRAIVRGRVIGVSVSAFPWRRFEGVAAAFAQTGSVTASLRRYGVSDYTRARSVVSCRMPTADEADALARPTSAPVLVVDYVNVDAQGVPVEAGTTLFASDAVQLSVSPEDFHAD